MQWDRIDSPLERGVRFAVIMDAGTAGSKTHISAVLLSAQATPATRVPFGEVA